MYLCKRFNVVPMPRSIKDRINKVLNEQRFNKEHGDDNFLIVKTNFKTDNKMERGTSKRFVFDFAEGIHNIKPVTVDTIYFKRKPYVFASNDLFDVVRSLTKRGYLLFKYIIDNIDYDSNRIDLDSYVISEAIGSDDAQIRSNALRELINKNIIEKVDTSLSKHIYAINIQEVFKGNFNDWLFKYREKYGESEH